MTDKLAEGLARVEEIHSGHLMRFALYIGSELVDRFSMKMAAEDEAEVINRHHDSIVKPLREKIEKLESELESHAWEISPAMAEAKIDEIEKDRDAWKEKCQQWEQSLVKAGAAAPAWIAQKAAEADQWKADAARLAEAAKDGHIFHGLCPDAINKDRRDPECPICSALLLHEKLKGGA